MLKGREAYRGGVLPRVVQIQVSRYTRRMPARGEALTFLVALHVEGSATTWQQNVRLAPAMEAQLLEWIDGLRRWSAGLGLTRTAARAAVNSTGAALRDAFLGSEGAEILAAWRPTAILWCIDETVIHLPWEMTLGADEEPLLRTPLGRIVTSRIMPRSGRDPNTEDPRIRILVVENPTEDLAASERVLGVISGLGDASHVADVEVVNLSRARATRRGFAEAMRGRDFDIVHFSGHGLFNTRYPGDVSLVLADGRFDDEAVLKLEWSRPPFVVVNSSCESGRAAPGRRIVTRGRATNGLAAAFLSRGVEAYLGHYFLVPDQSAADFSEAFYSTLFETKNVGTAVQRARVRLLGAFDSDTVDLTAFGVTFFGDSGTAERYDLATAA
jgi:hypothetical protein